MHEAMAMVFLNLRPHLTDRSEPRSANVTAGEREALKRTRHGSHCPF